MKRTTKRLAVKSETLALLSTPSLVRVRGGDSAEPTGSILHNLCNSVGCPKPP